MSLIAPAELAEMLKISVGHVYRMVHLRKIPFCKIGGSLRFRSESIDRWIAAQEIVSVSQVLHRKIR
jgi:excisionase family DNA binding protein